MPVRVGLKFIEKWGSDLERKVCKYEARNDKKGQIVFYGPSNFTRWDPSFGMRPLEDDILGASGNKCAINRGFGSSCSEHHLYYYPRMVRPLEPKVLVYAGSGNATAFGYSAEETWELAQRVLMYALTDFPDIRIYLMGANPRREETETGMAFKAVYNAKAREFCMSHPNCFYHDPREYAPLLRKDIFVEDGVHFTQEGYDIYGDFFREVLKDELAKY